MTTKKDFLCIRFSGPESRKNLNDLYHGRLTVCRRTTSENLCRLLFFSCLTISPLDKDHRRRSERVKTVGSLS